MSDRGFVFLVSLVIVLASLGVAGWLVGTGQAFAVDGLFLLLTCLLLAFGFGLYVAFLVRQALKEVQDAPGTAAPKGSAQSRQPKASPAAPEKPVKAEKAK
jgi:hypothetical protein